MSAVAVWDHEPSASELLSARVQRGWKPTPTATKDGEQVEGYASCLIPGKHPGRN